MVIFQEEVAIFSKNWKSRKTRTILGIANSSCVVEECEVGAEVGEVAEAIS